MLWLAAALLALLSVPLFGLLDSLQTDLSALQTAIQEAQVARIFPVTGEELSAIRASATAVAVTEGSLRSAFLRANQGRIAWASVLECIVPDASSHIQLTSQRQHQDRLVIQGVADNDLALIAYVGHLRGSPLFEDVQVASAAVTPTATAKPSATSTATHTPPPSATPTSTSLDSYEPDDLQPRPIDLGVPQAHSFHPNSDVDRAHFLGKAARRYRVLTTQLAPGVDTILSVSVAGVVYTSDDRTPGDLSSYVEFTVPAQGDYDVSVLVTNRGRFAPNATYILLVEEVGKGDAFEPDDNAPRSISPGEVQAHSFYPEGDVDQVFFRVKRGRWYEVSTANLAVGVDTALSVRVGSTIYQNDDAAPGSYASRVVFLAAADEFAYVTVRNKDRYGPEQTYQLTVAELAQAPTASPIPTATPMLSFPASSPGVAVSLHSQPRPAGVAAPLPAHDTSTCSLGIAEAPPLLEAAGQPLIFVISLRLKGYQP